MAAQVAPLSSTPRPGSTKRMAWCPDCAVGHISTEPAAANWAATHNEVHHAGEVVTGD